MNKRNVGDISFISTDRKRDKRDRDPYRIRLYGRITALPQPSGSRRAEDPAGIVPSQIGLDFLRHSKPSYRI